MYWASVLQLSLKIEHKPEQIIQPRSLVEPRLFYLLKQMLHV